MSLLSWLAQAHQKELRWGHYNYNIALQELEGGYEAQATNIFSGSVFYRTRKGSPEEALMDLEHVLSSVFSELSGVLYSPKTALERILEEREPF